MSTRSFLLRWLPVLVLAGPGLAAAHVAWLEPAGTEFVVRYGGHGEGTEPYDPTKVQHMVALDAQGRQMRTAPEIREGQMHLKVQGQPALLALSFDNRLWSKSGDKWKNVPRSQNPGATEGSWSYKFGKTVLSWSPLAERPLGHRLEIVPQRQQPPVAGQPMSFTVWWEGAPLPDAEVVLEDQGRAGRPQKTDANGQVMLRPGRGVQMVSVYFAAPLVSPEASRQGVEAVLRFEVR